MIFRWAQELLGCQFTAIHRSNRMVIDVDSLIRLFDPLIVYHCVIASILYKRSKTIQPLYFDPLTFHNSATSKLPPPLQDQNTTPILTSSFVTTSYTTEDQEITMNPTTSSPTITSSPVLYNTANDTSFVLYTDHITTPPM